MKTKSAMGIMTLFIIFVCLNIAQGAEKKEEKTMPKNAVQNPAGAQTSGTATGILTINPKATFEQGDDEAKTIKLSYAHVQERIDPIDEATRTIPFAKKKREIWIVLSDQPIPAEAMEDTSGYGVDMLVQTGKLPAIVEFSLTPEWKPSGGMVRYKMLSLSLNEQSYKFERKAFDNKTVAGKISMDERDIFSKKPKYSLTATFSAPIQPEPKPTAQGPAAVASGPGKVVAEYMRAMRTHDVAALKQICQDSAMQKIEGPDGKAYVQSINDWLKPGLQIVRVYEYPNWAKVDMELPNGSYTTSTKVIRINGSWKK